MGKNYLQISFGDGSIFQYSKTPKEGYDSHTNSKGEISYRKTYNKGLYGFLKGVSLREGNFGNEISIEVLDCAGDTNFLSMPLLTAKGNIGPFAESFISYLPYLQIGKDYRIYPYSMEVEGSTFARKGISIRYTKTPGEDVWMEDEYKIPKLTFTYQNRRTGEWIQGIVPPVEYTTDFKGETKTNTDKKDAYLFSEILLKYSKDERKKNTPQTPGAPNQGGAVPPANIPPVQQGMAPNTGFQNNGPNNPPMNPGQPPVQGGAIPGNNVPPPYNPPQQNGAPGHSAPPMHGNSPSGPNNPPAGTPFPPNGPGIYDDNDDLPF